MSPASERTVRLSVLDRLIDDAPKEAADAPGSWESSFSELRHVLLRDVEWLLNTRQVAEPAPDSCGEVQRSVYSFGIPDVTSMSESEASRGELARAVAECIRLFEPRLTAVRVTQKESGRAGGRGVRFTVEALLRLDPSPERVVFDTVVETVSGRVLVAGEADA
jgi:type VI secretion system protein ImpF